MYSDICDSLRACAEQSVAHCQNCHEVHTPGAKCAVDLMRKAADAIEELNKLLKGVHDAHNEGYDVGYRAGRRDYEPKWIPVTERLPNVDTTKSGYEHTTVIVACCGRKKSRPMVYERACVRGKIVYRWKWIRDRIYDGPPVTHWMPLPEPPKEVPTDV